MNCKHCHRYKSVLTHSPSFILQDSSFWDDQKSFNHRRNGASWFCNQKSRWNFAGRGRRMDFPKFQRCKFVVRKSFCLVGKVNMEFPPNFQRLQRHEATFWKTPADACHSLGGESRRIVWQHERQSRFSAVKLANEWQHSSFEPRIQLRQGCFVPFDLHFSRQNDLPDWRVNGECGSRKVATGFVS